MFFSLCFIAGVAAIWCGWVSRPIWTWVAGVVATAILTLAFSVDAVNNPENDGLWGVGAMMVMIGAPVGFAALAGTAHWLRRHQTGPDPQ